MRTPVANRARYQTARAIDQLGEKPMAATSIATVTKMRMTTRGARARGGRRCSAVPTRRPRKTRSATARAVRNNVPRGSACPDGALNIANSATNTTPPEIHNALIMRVGV